MLTRGFVAEEYFWFAHPHTQAPASATLTFLFVLVALVFSHWMAPTLSAPKRAVVGKPGVWKKTTLDSKKRVEKFTQREFVGPVAWMTYAHDGRRVTTNVKLVKRTWQRPLGSTGSGTELPEKAFSPPPSWRR